MQGSEARARILRARCCWMVSKAFASSAFVFTAGLHPQRIRGSSGDNLVRAIQGHQEREACKVQSLQALDTSLSSGLGSDALLAAVRRVVAGADAAAKQRRQLAESLGKRSRSAGDATQTTSNFCGCGASMRQVADWLAGQLKASRELAESWFRSWKHVRWAQRFQHQLALMPSASGSWSTLGV